MTPTELKEARHRLGLSSAAFARAVGAGARTVRRWEAGGQDIPAPVVKLVTLWLDPRLPARLLPEGARNPNG